MISPIYDELADKSSQDRLRLCILHKRLRGPMSSSVLGEVFSSLVPLRSERGECVPEVIVQYAQEAEKPYELVGTKAPYFGALVPLRSERSENVPEVIVQYAQSGPDW